MGDSNASTGMPEEAAEVPEEAAEDPEEAADEEAKNDEAAEMDEVLNAP